MLPVLIAGGGPVGLTLALELASRDVPCMLVERAMESTRFPKMDITNARSMELFRRLGIASALRKVAVPEGNVFDVAWITTLTGHELHRFRYPSVTEAKRRIREQNDGSQPAEPAMRVSQVVIEPELKHRLLEARQVTARFGVALESFVQDEAGVTAIVRHAETGMAEEIRCAYLVGCDGGASRVREVLGVPLSGTPRIGQRFMVHFRSQALDILQSRGVTWHNQSLRGTIIAQDDKETWTLQTGIPGFRDVAPEGVDPHKLLRGIAGTDFNYEILLTSAWTPHLLLADAYGAGRVFMAGDAIHQVNPTGGYGMNTGIGDAIDLGWKLAAVHHGYAPPALLQSYKAERRPVGRRNMEGSKAHTAARVKVAAMYQANEAMLFDPTSRGDAVRASVGAQIALHGNAENESWGLEWGYCYADSPVIWPDADGFVQDDTLRYIPTTTPGTRLPCVYLADGRCLFDLLSPWFTLLVFGKGDASAFAAAAARRSIPLHILPIDEPRLNAIYERKLVLVRPDQHVAWRGNLVQDADAVLARVLGWSTGQ
jgi:2-polyprenyl-6-methoxyphenol hydroxylase-like FAD-dependent oxidoreductase